MKPQQHIVIAGGTGFLGQHTASHFEQLGWKVTILSRNERLAKRGTNIVLWDGKTLGDWVGALSGCNVLLNLAGKSVDCRYTPKNKKAIYDSRLDSTRVLGLALMKHKIRPKLWINASSATIYRHAEDRAMTETNGVHGYGFSVDVCEKWERLFYGFDLPMIRKVTIRTGIVFAKRGSVIEPFRNMVRAGLGGAMGSGSQMVSWLHITDFCRGIEHIIEDPKYPKHLKHSKLEGPVNLTAPYPLTNHEMMRQLRKRFGAPFGIHLPAWMLEVGAFLLRTDTELVLKSRWVVPDKLLNSGFRFSRPVFSDALYDVSESGEATPQFHHQTNAPTPMERIASVTVDMHGSVL